MFTQMIVEQVHTKEDGTCAYKKGWNIHDKRGQNIHAEMRVEHVHTKEAITHNHHSLKPGGVRPI